MVISLLFLSALAVLPLAVPAAHAATTYTITASDGSGCTALGGSWGAPTCTVTGTLTVNSGDTLDVGAGVTVAATSSADGIINDGTINNDGVMTGSSSCGDGIVNSGTINNVETMPGSSSCGSAGIGNSGTINNDGTMSGSGGYGGITNDGAGTINDDGTMSGSGGFYGIHNGGTINGYCGATVTVDIGSSPVAIPCYTVTFDQTGLPSGATWGVTANWGPFVLPVDHTASGSSVTVQVSGSLTYSFDTPVTQSGTTFGCSSGCSGASTISSATTLSASYSAPTQPLPPIPPGAAPDNLSIPTYGNATFTGYRIGFVGSAWVEYNIPGWNSTLFTQELYAGNPAAWDIFPVPVTSCLDSNGNVRTSGFFMSWFGGSLNSTEIVFGDYQSFTSSAVGWPALASCSG